MTLIVALRAQDGVVLASDGQATSASGVPTKTSTEKLDLLHGKIAYGCAGSAGLRQRVRELLQEEIGADDCSRPFEELRDRLHGAVNTVQKHGSQSHIPMHLGDHPPLLGVLFGGYSGGRPWIYEVTTSGDDQTHELGEAIGDGRHYAAYALVAASHYKLTERRLDQVRLLAYRAVNDAIRTDASRLGRPVQIAQITKGSAEQLAEPQLEAIRGAVTVWQENEREIFAAQTGDIASVDSDEAGELGIEAPSS